MSDLGILIAWIAGVGIFFGLLGFVFWLEDRAVARQVQPRTPRTLKDPDDYKPYDDSFESLY